MLSVKIAVWLGRGSKLTHIDDFVPAEGVEQSLSTFKQWDEASEALRMMEEGAYYSEEAGQWYRQGRRGSLENPSTRAARNPSSDTAAKIAEEEADKIAEGARRGLAAADDLVEYQGRMVSINRNDIFRKILRERVGGHPEGMIEPHAHHILFKKGLDEEQQALVREGQEILRRYDIDPIFGPENLTWAPNIKGQHTTQALKQVLKRLRAADQFGGTREDIVKALRDMGKVAAQR